MKYYANVTLLATEVTQGKKDPNKEYMQVLFMQGIDTDKLLAPTAKVFEECQKLKGKNVQILVEYNPKYGSVRLLEVSAKE